MCMEHTVNKEENVDFLLCRFIFPSGYMLRSIIDTFQSLTVGWSRGSPRQLHPSRAAFPLSGPFPLSAPPRLVSLPLLPQPQLCKHACNITTTVLAAFLPRVE